MPAKGYNQWVEALLSKYAEVFGEKETQQKPIN
jgi:hypothetical protein